MDQPETSLHNPFDTDAAPGPFYVGIDPGSTGGVAVLDSAGQIVTLQDQPKTPVEFAELVRLVTLGHSCVAGLEKVSGRAPFGATGNFSLGGHFMAWQVGLAMTSTPCHLLTPAKWREIIDTPKPKTKAAERSNQKLKLWVAEYVGRVWPDAEIRTPKGRLLDGRADAICIAERLRRELINGGVK